MPSSDHSTFLKGFTVHPTSRQGDSDALLLTLQSRILSNLSELLTQLFNKMDDVFFDLAQQARSNNEQTEYFDAMRELRLHTKDVDTHLHKELEFQFALLHKRHQDNALSKEPQLDLGLVEKERIEVDVALANIRSKMKAQYPDLLLHLGQRLNSYLKVEWLDETNIPLGTQTLVNAFSNAIDKFDMPLKIRLMVYKYFERFLVDNLRPLLLECNTLMADAGIDLPIKPPASQASASPTQNTPNHVTSPTAANESPDSTFEQISTLLSNVHSRSLNHQMFKATQDLIGPELKLEDLQAMLDKLQVAQANSGRDEEHSGEYGFQDMQLLMQHQLISTVKKESVRKLRTIDDHSISLISMVFEFVLDDHNIPDEISLLLGRLQIPMIRVALADRNFFNQPTHPARCLLKRLSQAAIGWERESILQRDYLMEEIRLVVNRILIEFHGDNMELFETLDAQFAEFLEHQQQETDKEEKRAVEEARGKSKLELSKSITSQLIADRMQGKTLPTQVINMIEGPWHTAMVETLLQHGRDSEAWTQCLQTLDQLIWSIQPEHALADRAHWLKIVPSLLKTICDTLESLSHPPEEVDGFLSSLWEIHSQILQTRSGTPLPGTRKVDHTIVDSAAMTGEASGTLPQHPAQTETEQRAELRADLLVLNVGQWIELITPEGQLRRCRLAFRDAGSDIFLFVSRLGSKTLETNIESMIRMAENGELRLLDHAPVWDRALDHITRRLKSEQEEEEKQPS